MCQLKKWIATIQKPNYSYRMKLFNDDQKEWRYAYCARHCTQFSKFTNSFLIRYQRTVKVTKRSFDRLYNQGAKIIQRKKKMALAFVLISWSPQLYNLTMITQYTRITKIYKISKIQILMLLKWFVVEILWDLVLKVVPQQGHLIPSNSIKISHTVHRFCPLQYRSLFNIGFAL